MTKLRTITLYLNKYLPWLLAAVALGWYAFHSLTDSSEKSTGTPLSIQLTRGPFTVYAFPSQKATTTALIIFGSGDWGWGYWEDAVCHQLQAEGYTVIGVDSMAYAKTDYDLDIMQSDFRTIIQIAKKTYSLHDEPLILGGYSMGAEQAIAVAGGPHPPEGTIGLLLVSPGQRGRYGLRPTDRFDVAPKGSNTFAMADFSQNLTKLRIVQWHAGLDVLDSVAWLDTLTAPHLKFVFPGAMHNYNYACFDFRQQLVRSVRWLLSPTPGIAAAVQPQN